MHVLMNIIVLHARLMLLCLVNYIAIKDYC